MMAQVLMARKTLFIGSQGAWREDYEEGGGLVMHFICAPITMFSVFPVNQKNKSEINDILTIFD
jgi:hypothetical protein